MKKTLLAALVLLSFASSAGTTVEQGTDVTDLHSPMVLNGPFPLANPATWGDYGMFAKTVYSDPAIYSDFYRYHCDGVGIVELRMRGAPDGEVLRVHLKGKVDATLAGHDKKFTFRVELLNDGKSVFTTESSDKVEDKDHAGFDFGFAVPRSVLQEQPETTMRITMRTQDY